MAISNSKIQRTQPPPNYITPHDSEIAQVAQHLGVNVYSADFVRDLANIAAGGLILPPSVRDEAIAELAKQTLPKAEDGQWEIGSQSKNEDGSVTWYAGYTTDIKEALAFREMILTKYHNNVCDFLNNVDFSSVPGSTPIEKALLLLKCLMIRQEQEYNNFPPRGMDNSDVESLPIFCHKGQNEASELNEIFEDMTNMDDIEDMFFEHHGQSDYGHAGVLKKQSIAEDMTAGRHLWLKVSRKLDNLSLMRVGRSSTFIPDSQGKETRSRPIKNFNELDKIRPVEYAYPKSQRKLRLATRASIMRERGTYEEKQQLLYIIIDASGSMRGERIHKAGGVLMNRLRAVVKGDAQVYCRFFDTKLYSEHKATTKAEALALMDEFRNENFGGGGTRIAKCAMEAHKRIEELLEKNELLTRPELIIVTDGDDRVYDLSVKDFHPTRVHAFVVGNTNNTLINFARETGGVGTGNL